MAQELERRIIFRNINDLENDIALAEEALDNANCDWDWDCGDRMMISDEGIEILDKANIDFDIVV